MVLTPKKRRVLFILSLGAFFVLVVLVIFYSLGYRFGSEWQLQKTGGIFIQSTEAGAEVIINGGKKKNTSILGERALVKNLASGVYTVEVSKENFWSWKKTLLVTPEAVEARDAVLIPKTPSITIIGTSSPQQEEDPFVLKNHTLYERSGLKLIPRFFSVEKYWHLPRQNAFLVIGEDGRWYVNQAQKEFVDIFEKAKEEPEVIAILESLLKTKSNILFDSGENRILYWDEHTIGSYWIGKRNEMPQWQKGRAIHVLAMPGKIRNIIFYPDHSDYIIMELGSVIFSVEMDQVGGQNITPLFEGSEPHILSASQNKMTVSDNKKITEVALP